LMRGAGASSRSSFTDVRSSTSEAASMHSIIAVLLCVCAGSALALDNGLVATPPMGYNTWYDVECSSSMNASVLATTAKVMVDSGLAALGYKFFNLDDCYISSRADDKTLVPDEASFGGVDGFKALVAKVHALGLKFGLYTDRGKATCAGRPAAQGYEELDARTYAEWQGDYLKEDSCNAPTDHATAFEQYGKMRDALNKTGRPIIFSLCGWQPWYAPAGAGLANLWRIGPDDTNWGGVLTNINLNAPLAEYAGPGGFNDPCLLLAEDHNGKQRITELQSRAQFSMWAIMASPLLISGNVRQMSAANLATYSNAEVIAVDQDKLGKQGRRLLGGNLTAGGNASTNVWARELTGGRWAFVFLNAGSTATTVRCDAVCLGPTALTGRRISVRDLWTHEELGERVVEELEIEELPAEGGHGMLLVTPVMSMVTV